MIWIPAGEFPGGEPDSLNSMFIKEFYIDKYEVTQREYKQVMSNNPSYFKCEDCSVENVIWYEADEYCRRVGKRLPTEWEWEKAAKAGTTSKYYWGDSESMSDGYAWYYKNSGNKTHPVGQKKPNAYGLYDMLGNVWEWTSSDHGSNNKILRGGSWSDNLNLLWSSVRLWYLPTNRLNYGIGFRCADGLFR
ncbi:MAG: formylglycine-generating enzyme family protein [Nitrospinae bacterium]|nr:formylglycine-generating enzyme family protein [Nitrospinota bacterium]